MDGPLRPGSVVFVETPEGVTHRDYVTHAWTENPVKEVLVKMAAGRRAPDRGSRPARLRRRPRADNRRLASPFAAMTLEPLPIGFVHALTKRC